MTLSSLLATASTEILDGKSVLVTGSTQGLGLAAGSGVRVDRARQFHVVILEGLVEAQHEKSLDKP